MEMGPQVITGRRCPDGFTFSVPIQHIIEQTLLHSMKSPAFQKSLIKVEGEPDVPLSSSSDDDDEMESVGSSGSDVIYKDPEINTAAIPIKLRMKRKFADSDPNSGSHSRRNSPYCETLRAPPVAELPNDKPLDMTKKCKDQDVMTTTTCTSNTANDTTCTSNVTATAGVAGTTSRACLVKEEQLELVTSIPTSWIMKGLTRADHLQFKNSVANASLSPYQKRKTSQDLTTGTSSANLRSVSGLPMKTLLRRTPTRHIPPPPLLPDNCMSSSRLIRNSGFIPILPADRRSPGHVICGNRQHSSTISTSSKLLSNLVQRPSNISNTSYSCQTFN